MTSLAKKQQWFDSEVSVDQIQHELQKEGLLGVTIFDLHDSLQRIVTGLHMYGCAPGTSAAEQRGMFQEIMMRGEIEYPPHLSWEETILDLLASPREGVDLGAISVLARQMQGELILKRGFTMKIVHSGFKVSESEMN